MSSITRRYVLKMGVLTAAASAATRAGGPWIARAQSKQLVVCSWGGAYQEAQRKTMFQPFEKETGIKIVEASPTDDYAHFGLGLSLARVGDHEAAAEYLALAVAMRPDRKHYTDALRQVRATLKFRRETP